MCLSSGRIVVSCVKGCEWSWVTNKDARMRKLTVFVCSSKLDRDISVVTALVKGIRHFLSQLPFPIPVRPLSKRLPVAMVFRHPALPVSRSEFHLVFLFLRRSVIETLFLSARSSAKSLQDTDDYLLDSVEGDGTWAAALAVAASFCACSRASIISS